MNSWLKSKRSDDDDESSADNSGGSFPPRRRRRPRAAAAADPSSSRNVLPTESQALRALGGGILATKTKKKKPTKMSGDGKARRSSNDEDTDGDDSSSTSSASSDDTLTRLRKESVAASAMKKKPTNYFNSSGSEDDDEDESVSVLLVRRPAPAKKESMASAPRDDDDGARGAMMKQRQQDDDDDKDNDSDDSVELLRAMGVDVSSRPQQRPRITTSTSAAAAAAASSTAKGVRSGGGRIQQFAEDDRRDMDTHAEASSPERQRRKKKKIRRLSPRMGSASASLSSHDDDDDDDDDDDSFTKALRSGSGTAKGASMTSDVPIRAKSNVDSGDGRLDETSDLESDDVIVVEGLPRGTPSNPSGPRQQSDESSVDTAELRLHLQDPVAHPPARSKRVVKELKEKELAKERQKQEQLRQQHELERQQQLEREARPLIDPSFDDEFRLGDDDDDDDSSSSTCSSKVAVGGRNAPEARPTVKPSTRTPGTSQERPPAVLARSGGGPVNARDASHHGATTPEPEAAPAVAFLQRPERSGGSLGIRNSTSSHNNFNSHSAHRLGTHRLTDGQPSSGARSNPYQQRSTKGGVAASATTKTKPKPGPIRRGSAPGLPPPSSTHHGPSAAAFGMQSRTRPTAANAATAMGPSRLSFTNQEEPPHPLNGGSNEDLLEAAFWHESEPKEHGSTPHGATTTVVVREGLRSPPSTEHAPYRPPLRQDPVAADDIRGFSDDECIDSNALDNAAFGFAPSPRVSQHPSHDPLAGAESTFYGEAVGMHQVAPAEPFYMDRPTSHHHPSPPRFLGQQQQQQQQPPPPYPSLDDFKSGGLERRKRIRDAVASNPLNVSGVVLRSAHGAVGAGAASHRLRQPHPLGGLSSQPQMPWRSQSTTTHPSAAPLASNRFGGFASGSSFTAAPAPQHGAVTATSHSNDQAWSLALAPRTAGTDDYLTRPSRSVPSFAESNTGGDVYRGQNYFDGHGGNGASNNAYYDDEEEEEENFGNRGGGFGNGGGRRGRGSFTFRGGSKGGGGKNRPWRNGFGRGNRRGAAGGGAGGGGGRARGGRAGRGRGGGTSGANSRWARSTSGSVGGGAATTSRDDPNLRHVGGADMSF